MAEYIEREAVCAACNNGEKSRLCSVDCILHEIPASDVVAVVHGRWILHDNGSGTCDQCRFTQKNVWDDDNSQNYCGVCGAKMDGGDNDA